MLKDVLFGHSAPQTELAAFQYLRLSPKITNKAIELGLILRKVHL